MKIKFLTSIMVTVLVLAGCGTPQIGSSYIAPQQINEPTISEVTPVFETQIERVNNCDGANPTYNISYKTIQTQKATFEVTVGAGGLVTGTPIPPFLEAQLEAKITAALAKDYGLTTEKNHDLTLDNLQGTFLEHTITWKVTRVKGLVEVIYGDGVAQVGFDKIADVELYDRTSKPLGCDSNGLSKLPASPDSNSTSVATLQLETSVPASSFQAMLDSAQVLFKDNFDDPLLPGWLRWGSSPTLHVQNGTVFFSSGDQLNRNYGLQENEACLIGLKFSSGSNFWVRVTPGGYDSDWRSWGLLHNPDNQPDNRLQNYFQEGIGDTAINVYEPFSLQGQADTSYNVLLWVNNPTGFTIRVWEKDNPNVFGEKQYQMSDSENWVGRKWHCSFDVNSGSVQVNSYSELRITQSP